MYNPHRKSASPPGDGASIRVEQIEIKCTTSMTSAPTRSTPGTSDNERIRNFSQNGPQTGSNYHTVYFGNATPPFWRVPAAPVPDIEHLSYSHSPEAVIASIQPPRKEPVLSVSFQCAPESHVLNENRAY